MTDLELEGLLGGHYERLAPRPDRLGWSLVVGFWGGAVAMLGIVLVLCLPVAQPVVPADNGVVVGQQFDFGNRVPTLDMVGEAGAS